jgi:hypothetical protein
VTGAGVADIPSQVPPLEPMHFRFHQERRSGSAVHDGATPRLAPREVFEVISAPVESFGKEGSVPGSEAE